MSPWRVVAARALGRGAVVVVAALPATAAHPALAIDITGTWAVCLSRLGHEPSCPFALTGTLVGAGAEFSLTLTQVGSCTTTGTVDPDTGIMTRTGGCAPELVGSATDTALSGTMSLVVCTYRFDGVRPCGACDDGIACTVDGCGHTACSVSSLSTCTHVEGTGPAYACPACERCDVSTGCRVRPSICRTPVDPTKSRLVLRSDAAGTRDSLTWKWAAGHSTLADEFADPTTTDDYTLCVFDRLATEPRLLLKSVAPAGSAPGAGSYWRATGNPPGSSGFTYRSTAPFAPDGLSRVKLGPGGEGRAKVTVKGKGSNLEMPAALDVTPPVRVQLQHEGGRCWETSFGSAVQNRADLFRAKGGP